ncbi:MAG TPA: hypothetical protein VFS77_07220, partial [Pyrinomonadaceae bacterium]|nr:hypothetical protein [Pyrinomonadaceae bacterium]
ALPQKSFEAAPPSDVRRGFASPVATESMKGCALGSGFALIFMGPKAVPGAQPHLFHQCRRGKASPHIRRQSR